MILLSPSSKVIWSSPHRVKDGLIWQPLTAPPLGNLVGEVVEGYAMNVDVACARCDLHASVVFRSWREGTPPPPLLNLDLDHAQLFTPGSVHLRPRGNSKLDSGKSVSG